MVVQPDINEVFAVIERAVPLLEQLKAAKANVANYTATLQQYQQLLQVEQDTIAAIGVELHNYALEFVKLYVPDIVEQVQEAEAQRVVEQMKAAQLSKEA